MDADEATADDMGIHDHDVSKNGKAEEDCRRDGVGAPGADKDPKGADEKT